MKVFFDKKKNSNFIRRVHFKCFSVSSNNAHHAQVQNNIALHIVEYWKKLYFFFTFLDQHNMPPNILNSEYFPHYSSFDR